MKRAVGYCLSSDCEDRSRGIFLLNHGGTFHCPRCRQLGILERESGSYVGQGEVFREVRVDFDYDPDGRYYRATAVVRDESLGSRGGNVYTLRSPLVKTDKRALKIAESILSNLNRYRGLLTGKDADEVRSAQQEHVLRFDDSLEDFRRELSRISAGWAGEGR